MFSFPAVDHMIAENKWICPIKPQYGDNAYYSPAKDEIVIPTREQFVDGEAFATNTLHECAHATGAESRLNRDMKHPFGSPEYAKEELKKQLNQKDSDSEEVVNLEDADLESVAGGSGLGDFFKKHWPAIVTFVGVSALAYFGMKKFTGTSAAGKAAAGEGEAAEAGAATKAANKASVGKGVATGMGFLALGVVPSVLNSLGSDNQ